MPMTQPLSTDDVFDLIEHERIAIADLATDLTPAQWETASLAEGWRVREVVAHLTMIFSVSNPSFLLGLIRHRSMPRYMDDWARRTAEAPVEDLVERLRAGASDRFTPPGAGPQGPLTDLVVHGLDIRLPLGLPVEVAPEAALTTFGVLTSRRGGLFGVTGDPFSGRRLETTDLDWGHGTGPVTRAGTIDMILHLSRGIPLPTP